MDKPWESEPDELAFEESGLACRLARGPGKHWCGYVGIPEGHPLYKLNYSAKVKAPKALLERTVDHSKISIISMFWMANSQDQSVDDGYLTIDLLFDVHGGLTWAEGKPGGYGKESDGLWWFGFDCAHAGDLSPKYEAKYQRHPDYVYRDIAFAENECRSLAKQLAAYATLAKALPTPSPQETGSDG